MDNLLRISVLVQTKNEERGIRSCLAGLRDFDEVIVVDSNSEDATKEIAQSMGVEVVNFSWNREYPKKKQWQLDNLPTAHPWVLFIDADEQPTPELVSELRMRLPRFDAEGIVAADIPLSYVFAGRELRFGHRVVKRSLVRRGRVAYPVMDDLLAPGMGELEGHYQPIANGKTCRLKSKIFHNDLDPVRTWFERHNRYSDWEAYLRLSRSRASSVASSRSVQGRVFDRLPAKPIVFFLYCYLIRFGFLDGRAGLDYAIGLSTYYWQIGLKVRERARLAAAAGDAQDVKP